MSNIIGEVGLRVRPVTDTFAAELEAKLKGASAVTAGTGANIEKNIGGAVRKTGQEVDKFEKLASKNFEHLASETSIVGKGFSQLEGAGFGLTKSLAGMGPEAIVAGVAVAGVAVAAGEGVKHFLDLAGQVKQFQAVSGASAEESSRFVVALRELGIEPTSVSRGLFKLSNSLKSGKADLAAYGVEAVKDSKGNVDLTETSLNIADAIQRIGPGARANTLAMQAFGRAGLQLIPTLLRGREGLQEFFAVADKRHEVFNQKDIDSARDFQIGVRSLKEAGEALEITLGKGLVPTLAKVVSGFTAVLETANDLADSVGGLAGIFRGGLALATLGVSEMLIKLGEIHNKNRKSTEDDTKAQKDAAAAAIEEADAAAKAADGIATAQAGIVDVQISADRSALALKDSQSSLTDAEKELTKAQHGEGESMRAAAEAKDRLRQATQALEDAEHRSLDTANKVRDAREKLTEAQFRQGTGSKEARDASDELNDALYDQKRAGDEVTDAKKKQSDAQATADSIAASKAHDVEDAERKVQAARLDVAAAASAEAKAETDLTVARDAAKGVIDTATTKLDLYRQNLDRVVADLQTTDTPLIDQINKFLSDLNAPTARPDREDATARSVARGTTGLAPAGAPKTAVNLASVGGGQGVVNINFDQKFYQPSDPMQISADVAWRLTGPGAPFAGGTQSQSLGA